MNVKRKSKSRPPAVPVERTQLQKRLIEAFDVFDNAKTQQVDVRELGTIIRSIGCVITEAELQEIQVEVEDVENNCVPQDRFVDYMCKAISEQRYKPADPEDLLKAFQVLDPENRGYVSRNDLEKAVTEVGEPFNAQEVNEMMSIACDSKTNRIHYEHYINSLIPRIPDDKNAFKVYEHEELERIKLEELEKLKLALESEDTDNKHNNKPNNKHKSRTKKKK